MTPETAIRRGILATLLAVLVSASAGWAQDQPQQPQNPRQPVRIDPAYSKVANQTGGQVYVIDRSKVNDLAKIMQMTSQGDREELLSVNDRLDGSGRSYHASVDPAMALLMVSVTGTKDFDLQRPSGSPVGKQENVVQYVEVANGSIYTIQNPEPGEWTATLRGSGDVSIRINAVRSKQSSAVQFDRFEFVEPGGRPGHEGMFRIQGYPLAGSESAVDAQLDGEISAVHFEFRAPSGQVLNSFRLRKLPESGSPEYAGKVKVPEVPFVVYAVGVDMHGAPFQRVRPGQIQPQSFRVQAPSYWELKPGENASCTVTVTNYGPDASFRVLTADPNHLLRDLTPKTFSLNSGEETELTLSFQVPADPKVVGESLVVTVESVDTAQTNFALIETTVTRP